MHSYKTPTGTTSGSGYAIASREYEKTGSPGNLEITLDYSGTAFWGADVAGQGGANGGAAYVEVLPDTDQFPGASSVERSANGSSSWGLESGTSSDDDSVQKTLASNITLYCYIAVTSSAFANAIDYGEGKATGSTTWH